MRVQIEMLRQAWKQAKNHLRPIADLRYLPRNLPTQCEGIVTDGGRLRVGMPLDPPLMREVANAFRLAGWEVKDYKHEMHGMWMEAQAKYERHSGSVVLCYLTAMDYKEGSTCKIERIGEETVTKTVYETVCNDGSKEKVFV